MDLKISNKLVAFKGCIGRREYFMNILLVTTFFSVLGMPLNVWVMQHFTSFNDVLQVTTMFSRVPVFCSFFYVLAVLVSLILSFGLIARRLADIWGRKIDYTICCLAILKLLFSYYLLFNLSAWTSFLLFVDVIINLLILFSKGKITSQLPHDEVKVFNWGAFWGTWIWGLFNRSYITLLAIPLFFTPAFLPWALYCGFKGNEWAFKNTQALDGAKFHAGQKKQSIVWNILAGFVVFILPVFIFFLGFFCFFLFSLNNSDNLDKLQAKTENFVESFVLTQFDDYSLDVNENCFYIKPEVWITLSYEEKYNLLKIVSSFALIQKETLLDEKYEGYDRQKFEEMLITRIYSAYNGELLAEFDLDLTQATGFFSSVSAVIKGLKFNTTPQLPPKD